MTADKIRLSFDSRADAERNIAGVAAVAHPAAEAYRQGARQIWVHLADGKRLSSQAVADIRRACPGVLIHFDFGDEAEHILDFNFRPLSGAEILRSTEKSSDGLVSRWINRPISRAISAVMLRSTHVRPWHATVVTGIVGIAMLLCLLSGGYRALVAGALLFQAASILDGVDGEIARATYRSTPQGAKLDTSVDMAINVAFVVGVSICLTSIYGSGQAIAGGGAALLVVSGLLIMSWLARQLGEPGNFNFLKRYYRERYPTGLAAAITDALVITTSRDFFAFAIAVVVVLGWGSVVTLSLLCFAVVWFGFILLAVRPILRECGLGAGSAVGLSADDGPRLA